MRLDDALRQAREQLAASPSPGLDAELLLCRVIGESRTYLRTWPERTLSDSQQRVFQALVTRRAQGEPVAHLTGEREFFGRPFLVSPHTLIPRPDTETLVEAVLETLPESELRAVDLGTGSGAIGVTLALERPAWSLTLTDASRPALAVARDNAERLGARVGLVCNDHGLADLRVIAAQAHDTLAPGGWLVLEHGFDQGGAVRTLLGERGFQDVTTRQDLEGRDRVTLGHV